MPGSQSRQEAEQKDVKATSPTSLTKPKPILKEPSFGLPTKGTTTPPGLPPDSTTFANTAANIDPAGVEPLTNTPKAPAADHAEDAQIAEKEMTQQVTAVQS